MLSPSKMERNAGYCWGIGFDCGHFEQPCGQKMHLINWLMSAELRDTFCVQNLSNYLTV